MLVGEDGVKNEAHAKALNTRLMIPRIIHYCWFGRGEMPDLAKSCIASWHEFMPDWEYRLWNEDSFDVNSILYTKEAYEAKKSAFVSDYVRLWALFHEGGVYLDVDFEVFKPFDDLLHWSAFAGFEGSKHSPLMMGVIASCPQGIWIGQQLNAYNGRHFIYPDGTFDMTTNVKFVSERMRGQGFAQNGLEQDFYDLHIFPVDYFCPKQTTGEYLRTENTYCESKGLGSWEEKCGDWKVFIGRMVGPKNMTRIIKLKRKLFG